MVVRIAVVVLLLGLVAVARPAPAEADSPGPCRHDNYLEAWLYVDTIYQAYVDSEFRVDEVTTGYHLDVTRVWKGRPQTVVTVYTGPRRTRSSDVAQPPRFSVTHNGVERHRLENFIYYKEGYQVHVSGPSDDTCSPQSLAKEFAGSELAALRIVHYSLWGITVVMAAVLALILRAAWRRRARA